MTEKNFLTKTLTDTVLSRRSFLKWSVALGGTAALAGGMGYGLKAVEAAAENVESEGKWICGECSVHAGGCGSTCKNYILVKDGVVISQKADDSATDSPDNPLHKGCVRGRAQRTHVFSDGRLKYPMKRKNWEPGGGKKELRGKDEWVRISWEEALDLTAAEIKRVKETYGNEAIMSSPYINCTLLAAYGGYRSCWGVNSQGSWPIVLTKMAGGNGMYGAPVLGAPDRFSQRKAKLIVLWGENVAWSRSGPPTYNFLQCREAGAKFIFVTPELNSTAVALGAEWIPVRPSTDTALLQGMAYYMITNNLQDQEFLDKYCIGFDAQHMPKGVPVKDNFKDYVLGTYDGVPKTPEWASDICGTDPELIRQFAHEIATTKPMIFESSNGAARTDQGHQFCMAFLTVGWMTGNVGLPGAAVCYGGSGNGGMYLTFGGSGEPLSTNPLMPKGGMYDGYSFMYPFDTDWVGVTYAEIADAILNKECTATVRGKMPCDIRMWYAICLRGNTFNQVSGTPKSVKALRKLEFVVALDTTFSNKSKYADIVMPGTTRWEEYGNVVTSDNQTVIVFSQVTSPLHEARDLAWVETELAKRLGIDLNTVHPLSPQQRFFKQIAGSAYFSAEAMNYVPLVTITEEDIKEWDVDVKPQKGLMGIQEFIDQGGYSVPRTPGDVYNVINDNSFPQMFRADPVANPVLTESGKLEIYCKELASYITAYGFDKGEPIAKYIQPVEGIEDTYADWEKKIKGDYPLQMFTPHILRRAHSSYNNVPTLRRAFPQEFMMNIIDAEARGIKTGDTVLVTSRHGKVLRRAKVSEFIIPGAVSLGEGAWFDFDEETGIDKGGCTNTLSGTRPGGMGMEPFNSCNVQVQKWAGKPLEPDYKWPQRIPLKEA